MSELNETNQDLIDIVVEHKDAEDNVILGKLIGAGVPFNKAKGLLDKIMVGQGLKMTATEMNEKAAEILASFSVTEETTAEEVQEQIENLVDELNCTVNKARNYVKAEFTGADIAYPKATKAAGGPRTPKEPGFRGDVKIAGDYAIANPVATEDDLGDFKAFMDANGGSTTSTGKDKSKKWHSAVLDLRIFAKAWKDAGNCS